MKEKIRIFRLQVIAAAALCAMLLACGGCTKEESKPPALEDVAELRLLSTSQDEIKKLTATLLERCATPPAQTRQPHDNAPPEARALWEQAIASMKEAPHDFQKPTNLLLQAIKKHSDYPMAYYSLGWVQMKKGDIAIDGISYENSLKSFIKAFALGADWMGLYNNMAAALRKLGRSDEAVPFLEMALKKKGKKAFVLNNYAEILLERGHTKKAAEYLKMAEEEEPDNNLTRRNLRRLNEIMR
jgi:tetratricopeptide (TPR) repeat protein